MSTRKPVQFTEAQHGAIVRLAGLLQAETGRVYSLADAVWEAVRRVVADLGKE